MLKAEIEEFAKVLVREVRDRSVASCDGQMNPESNSPVAKRWRQHLSTDSSTALAKSMIPDCIDDALFHLLHAIDTGALHLSFVANDGSVVDLTNEGEGELSGWYMMSEEGWRSRFTEQRFADDLQDLS